MLSIILRIALSTRKQSAMLAASVKSSFSVGGLMKATCAAPIFTHHVSIMPGVLEHIRMQDKFIPEG